MYALQSPHKPHRAFPPRPFKFHGKENSDSDRVDQYIPQNLPDNPFVVPCPGRVRASDSQQHIRNQKIPRFDERCWNKDQSRRCEISCDPVKVQGTACVIRKISVSHQSLRRLRNQRKLANFPEPGPSANQVSWCQEELDKRVKLEYPPPDIEEIVPVVRQ